MILKPSESRTVIITIGPGVVATVLITVTSIDPVAPLPDISVELNGTVKITDESGTAEFRGIALGEYNLMIYAIGYIKHSEKLSIFGDMEITRTLTPGKDGKGLLILAAIAALAIGAGVAVKKKRSKK